MWREVFDRVGGFENEHPAAKAEDAEFCIRAWEFGYEAGFAPGALMIKARRQDLASTIANGTATAWAPCSTSAAIAIGDCPGDWLHKRSGWSGG